MIYVTFTIWLLLIMLTAMALQRAWSLSLRPTWVSWVLLPGTVVSEMAYIFGSLITGGEIRHAKIVPGKGGEDEQTTQAAPRVRIVGPVVAALASVLACAACIIAADALLGTPVLSTFASAGGMLSTEAPTAWGDFWSQAAQQVRLVQRMAETLGGLNWLDYRVPLFVYLAACLSVRLAPAGRDFRASMAAVIVIAVVIAVIGMIAPRLDTLMVDIWPLLTYVWASLLFLLVLTLVVRGLVQLAAALAGRPAPKTRKPAGGK